MTESLPPAPGHMVGRTAEGGFSCAAERGSKWARTGPRRRSRPSASLRGGRARSGLRQRRFSVVSPGAVQVVDLLAPGRQRPLGFCRSARDLRARATAAATGAGQRCADWQRRAYSARGQLRGAGALTVVVKHSSPWPRGRAPSAGLRCAAGSAPSITAARPQHRSRRRRLVCGLARCGSCACRCATTAPLRGHLRVAAALCFYRTPRICGGSTAPSAAAQRRSLLSSSQHDSSIRADGYLRRLSSIS